jgi:hypothetical protein
MHYLDILYYPIALLLHVSGHPVAQLVEVLCYKSGGHGFNSRCCQWNLFIDVILPAALWP